MSTQTPASTSGKQYNAEKRKASLEANEAALTEEQRQKSKRQFTLRHNRPLAHGQRFVLAADMKSLLDRLYDPEYLVAFSNMRQVFNLNLHIALMTALRGLRSETIYIRPRPEVLRLRWEDVGFCAFLDAQGAVEIQANIRFEFGIIPLRHLLPLSMVFEDTLRLLIIVALMDGVFDGFRSWSDLYNVHLTPQHGRTGHRFGIKPALRTVPVLRRMENHKLTNQTIPSSDLDAMITRLGKYCGFEDYLGSASLRRGAGVSDEAHLEAALAMAFEQPDAVGTPDTTQAEAFDSAGSPPGDNTVGVLDEDDDNSDNGTSGAGPNHRRSTDDYPAGSAHQNSAANNDDAQAGRPKYRRHDLSNLTGGTYSARRIGVKGNSSYMDLKAELRAPGLTDAGACKILQEWWSITHGIDDFDPGQEPIAGTYECRFCDTDLSTVPEKAIRACPCMCSRRGRGGCEESPQQALPH